MIGIVTGDLICRLTGEKTHRREVDYCITAKESTSIRPSSPKALRWRARATTRAMCLSSRRPRWRNSHVHPIVSAPEKSGRARIAVAPQWRRRRGSTGCSGKLNFTFLL
jgi:hypothetical protein